MDSKFNTLLSIAIIPQVVALIIENKELGELEALNAFYSSKTYEVLSREETKVWHFSPKTLFMMWESEIDTGEILFPEEC